MEYKSKKVKNNAIVAVLKIGPYQASVSPSFHCAALLNKLENIGELVDTARDILQDGRNLTVKIRIPGPKGEFEAVLKRFGKLSKIKDLVSQHRGSKALRAFNAAYYLEQRGILTPAPVAALDRRENGRLVESYLITEFIPGMTGFGDKLIDLYSRDCPCSELLDLVKSVAVFAAGMHDAGFQHRDFGNQNILFSNGNPLIIDLNRGKFTGEPLTLSERARDISRINLPSDIMRFFNDMYWRGEVPPERYIKLEKKYRASYARHSATRRLRHPFRRKGPDAGYPSPRDIWIWDYKSQQAISAFRGKERRQLIGYERLWRTLRTIVSHGPGIMREYKQLLTPSFAAPVKNIGERAAVAVEGYPATIDRDIELLRELGVKRTLVRIYSHDSVADQDGSIECAVKLHDAGFSVSLALVQNRKAVNDAAVWLDLGRRALRKTAEFIDRVEIGHAVNRVKWGVWGFGDAAKLAAPVSLWRQEFPNVKFTGPACIDFEFDFLATTLDVLPNGISFDAMSHHLYVDRRGEPEAFQGNFDAVAKLALAKAIAIKSDKCGDGTLIVSEFNWPLAGTAEWSPVGSPYVSPGSRTNDPSVDENTAAAYTIRYLLLGLCSGFASEMVFWNLTAHGFGLVDCFNGEVRKRPAFYALKDFYAKLSESEFIKLEKTGRKIRMEFSNAIAEWSSGSTEIPVITSK